MEMLTISQLDDTNLLSNSFSMNMSTYARVEFSYMRNRMNHSLFKNVYAHTF